MLIWSLGGGGAQRVASDLSLNLNQNIHRIIVTIRNEISYPTNKPLLSMNLNLIKRNLIDGQLKYIYSIIVGSIKYRKLINEYKPDVSLSFLLLDNFINILSNIGNTKTKVILSIHWVPSHARNSPLWRFKRYKRKILYNLADLIVTVSKGCKQELIRYFNINPEKIRVIYNPVDIEKIRNLAREEVNDEWFDGELPILINMGRLTEAKGQWHLIRTFSKVRERKQCKLVICGNGELKSYLEKLVRDLGLTNDVKFLGWQDNPFKYISKSSIFVSSSLRESFGLAIIEAMTCGCPIIATDCKYGPSEILEKGKFGVLTPPMDGKFYKASDPLTSAEYYLANQIIRLLENESLRKKHSKKARKRSNDFDKKEIMRDYEKMMRQLISEGCARARVIERSIIKIYLS